MKIMKFYLPILFVCSNQLLVFFNKKLKSDTLALSCVLINLPRKKYFSLTPYLWWPLLNVNFFFIFNDELYLKKQKINQLLTDQNLYFYFFFVTFYFFCFFYFFLFSFYDLHPFDATLLHFVFYLKKELNRDFRYNLTNF